MKLGNMCLLGFLFIVYWIRYIVSVMALHILSKICKHFYPGKYLKMAVCIR